MGSRARAFLKGFFVGCGIGLLILAGVVFVASLSGCGSMKGEAYRIYGNPSDPNIITAEYYRASYETLFIDWQRHGFGGKIKGFGSIGSDESRVESEGAEIVSEVINPVKTVFKGDN